MYIDQNADTLSTVPRITIIHTLSPPSHSQPLPGVSVNSIRPRLIPVRHETRIRGIENGDLDWRGWVFQSAGVDVGLEEVGGGWGGV